MKKQTAVEFIAQELSKQIDNNLFMEVTFNKLFDQAIEMEKEQHNITWKESRIVKVVDTYHEKETSFDDYYSETFKK